MSPGDIRESSPDAVTPLDPEPIRAGAAAASQVSVAVQVVGDLHGDAD